MKNIFRAFGILIILCTVYINSSSQSGWFSQTSGVNEDLLDVKFLNNNTGYVCGKFGTFLKTTNGGLNWVQMNSFTSDIALMSFTDVNTGYVMTGGFRSDDLTYVKKTTNGGITFYNRIYLGPFYDTNGINMDFDIVGINTIYVVYTRFGFKTTNGGDDWEVMAYDNYFKKMSFFNVNTGYRYTDNTHRIEKTTNGGDFWTNIYYFQPHPQPCYLNFFNVSTGYLIDPVQGFYKTTNDGNNWQNYTITSNTNYSVKNAYFLNLNTGWTVSYSGDSGRGLVYKTSNAGENWFRQYVGTNQEIRAVNFVDENTGWIVGYHGIIYKTTNGGGSPNEIQPVSNEIPRDFILHQNFPNPFNPGTKIHFEIPQKALVRFIVYDMTGKEIAVLVNEILAPGKYQLIWNAANIASGVYLCSLETDEFKQTRKMIILK